MPTNTIAATCCEIYFYSIIDYWFSISISLSIIQNDPHSIERNRHWILIVCFSFKPTCFIAMNNSSDQADQIKAWAREFFSFQKCQMEVIFSYWATWFSWNYRSLVNQSCYKLQPLPYGSPLSTREPKCSYHNSYIQSNPFLRPWMTQKF